MFFDYLEKLRKKPENVRTRFALLFSGGFVGVIFVIWLVATFSVMKSESAPESKTASSLSAPLSALKDSFVKSLSGLKEQFGAMGNQFSSVAGFMSSSSAEVYVATSSPENSGGETSSNF